MRIGPRLEFRQTQALVMTPQLRQAIKLLQYSNMEVNAFIEEEMARNPVLERDERPDALPERPAPDQAAAPAPEGMDAATLLRQERLPDAVDADHANSFDHGGASDGVQSAAGARHNFESDDRSIEELVAAPRNLRDHLAQQLRLQLKDKLDLPVGAYLIALLDPAGRVAETSEAIAAVLGTEPARVERVRESMQRFDPPGLFALDLRDCLAAQLADRGRLDPAMQALLDNLDLLGRRDMRRLSDLCGVSGEDLADMVAELRTLDPKPAAGWNLEPAPTMAPDILMRRARDGGWLLELNPDTMPRVLVNRGFQASFRIRPGGAQAREAKTFLSEQLSNANWLVKSLQQRANTILKVAAEIVRQQDGFLLHGIGHLRPLILRDIAEAVELHESTISRVTCNKYIATPRGVLELKFFFTAAIQGTSGETHSAETVRHRIRALVKAENPDDVLSDDAIVNALRREGVDIARRTVAKYRDALRIPSSMQRKREKALPA